MHLKHIYILNTKKKLLILFSCRMLCVKCNLILIVSAGVLHFRLQIRALQMYKCTEHNTELRLIFSVKKTVIE